MRPCTCTIQVKRTPSLYSVVARIPKPGCPIHTNRKASQ